MNAKQIWQTTIERLQAKVKPEVFTTWFQGTSAHSFQDGVFIVRVPTTFAKAHLESRYVDTIHEVLVEIMGQPLEVKFVVSKEAPNQTEEGQEDMPTQKRLYRLPRKRMAQREKRNADATAIAAMTSMAPAPPHTSVHRINEQSAADPAPVLSDTQSMVEEPKHEPTIAMLFPGEGLLNARYTFSAFIVGKSNQLAHAASLAASENPGHIYNPLFLYGGVGLGKTHLLHAVGHMGEAKGLNVLYVTSEKFTNEIINAIRFQKTEEFRAKYRQIDILLVDDIQFIAGKESTEEEFFHTFNSLHSANKQIVVTSDRPPKAIHSLQDRLRSRFEWGLLADVQPPEYEHRLAILRSKAESLRFAIPSTVIDYIARPECSSVRELEGALNRVIAYATLHDAPLTMSLAVKALEHIYSDKKQPSHLTVTEVLEGVCSYYHVEAELLRGKQRDRDIVWPRQVAMYLMREETSASLLQVGAELGGRDHTTIMHGWEKVRSEIAHNDRVRQEIAAVLEYIQQKAFLKVKGLATMKIALGSDERTHLTDTVIAELKRLNHELLLFGPLAEDDPETDWPLTSSKVAKAVASGQADEGIVFCWTGTGASIAANKVHGVRAALCHDAQTAHGARIWNHANVLALSLRATTEAIAKEILEAWLNTPYSNDEWNRQQMERIKQLEEDTSREYN